MGTTEPYKRCTGAGPGLLPIALFIVSLCLPVTSFASAGRGPDRKTETLCLQAAHCTLHFRSREDLLRLERRLKVSYLGTLLDWKALRSPDPARRLVTKLNALFLRVQGILDMHPEALQTVIEVYPDRHAFESDFGYSYRGARPPKALFLRPDNSIALSLDDVNAHVLAHEIAHAVIHRQLGSATPEKAHEIMARYVDMHLKHD